MKRLLLLLLLLIIPWLLHAATLRGKATIAAEPVAGIAVSAYPVASLDFNAPAPFSTGPTAADGLFALELPEGEYYLLARGQNLFNFYGRNPVSVPKEGLQDINLLMLPDNLPAPDHAAQVETGVTGTVSLNGQAVANAIVMVYTDLSSRLKGMGLGWMAPTDENGYFEAPLQAGSYYLVVRVRKGGQMAGPLKAGDLFGYLPSNPLVVKDGEVVKVQIPVIAVPEKVERLADSLFGNTHITGKIVDAEGAPVAGVMAMLYEDPMMLNRPLYVSQATSPDGVFMLSFPSGGIYYLAARNQLGGTPAPGELYGRYAGSPDHSVRIRTGKALAEVEIAVEEVY